MKNIKVIISVTLFAVFFWGCDKGSADVNDSSSGKGGSTARFTIVDDYLYTVNSESLQIFNIANASEPNFINEVSVGFGVETIFPYENNLFLGTQTGMFIYGLATPRSPNKISQYEHIVSCDPVVVEGTTAYVTLRSIDNWCGRFTNELQIIDISNLSNPELLTTYSMSSPYGLGVDGDKLFICDDGLKQYDITDLYNIELINQFSIPANDVIPLGDILLVTAYDGIYQYSYNGDELTLLSQILISRDEG